MTTDKIARKQEILPALCVFCGLLCAASFASASTLQIGPGLYAYISENDASANSTFLVSAQGILVVDTGLNAQEGGKLLEEIRKVSPAPVRWIVNTHYHSDHRGGNAVVGPDAVVISTAFTRERAGRAAPGYALNETLGPGVLTLYVGGHEVRIYQPGPAHTLGDAAVYFPDQHAIATGDLFLSRSCPAMDEGDMENWIVALDRMLTLPVEHVVPGHFELATKNEMRHFRDYLADVRDQVASLHQKGMTLEEVEKRLDLKSYDDLRQFPQYEATFRDNAAAYYRQLEQHRKVRRQTR